MPTAAPKNESELVQLIMMGESIRKILVMMHRERQSETHHFFSKHLNASMPPLCIYFISLPISDEWIIIFVWVSPLSFYGRQECFLNFIQFFDENSLSKQNSPRYDAAFCGVTSGAILFAYVP